MTSSNELPVDGLPPTSTLGASEPVTSDTSNTNPVDQKPPKASLDASSSTKASVDPAAEFVGDLDTNHTIPTQAILNKIKDYPVLDVDGKARPFKSIYTGPNIARRVLVIFVRHFFCGNCQEYLRALSASITTASLLQLPVPTFIAIIACGSPSLIPMYTEATSCPFPIYADPSRKLYEELGMVRTLALGPRPEYVRQNPLSGAITSIWQGLKQVTQGRAHKAGDIQQVGGEFLFEPIGDVFASPVTSPGVDTAANPLGFGTGKEEEKRVTWCHRMKNTRDHAEIPELREVLGLDGLGGLSKASVERKGTGFSAMTTQVTTSSSILSGAPDSSNNEAR